MQLEESEKKIIFFKNQTEFSNSHWASPVFWKSQGEPLLLLEYDHIIELSLTCFVDCGLGHIYLRDPEGGFYKTCLRCNSGFIIDSISACRKTESESTCFLSENKPTSPPEDFWKGLLNDVKPR